MKKLLFKSDLTGKVPIGITNGFITLKEGNTHAIDSLIKKHHYSKKTTKNRFLSFTINKNKGFLQLGYGIRPSIKNNIHKLITKNNYCEFDRMWLDDSLPKFSESQTISLLLSYLKQVYPHIWFVITYADGSVGNTGVIYKATNAFRMGKKKVDFYLLPNGERVHPVSMWHRHKTRAWKTMKKIYPGIKHITDEYQYRYLYILNKKIKRKYLRKLNNG